MNCIFMENPGPGTTKARTAGRPDGTRNRNVLPGRYKATAISGIDHGWHPGDGLAAPSPGVPDRLPLPGGASGTGQVAGERTRPVAGVAGLLAGASAGLTARAVTVGERAAARA